MMHSCCGGGLLLASSGNFFLLLLPNDAAAAGMPSAVLALKPAQRRAAARRHRNAESGEAVLSNIFSQSDAVLCASAGVPDDHRHFPHAPFAGSGLPPLPIFASSLLTPSPPPTPPPHSPSPPLRSALFDKRDLLGAALASAQVASLGLGLVTETDGAVLWRPVVTAPAGMPVLEVVRHMHRAGVSAVGITARSPPACEFHTGTGGAAASSCLISSHRCSFLDDERTPVVPPPRPPVMVFPQDPESGRLVSNFSASDLRSIGLNDLGAHGAHDQLVCC